MIKHRPFLIVVSAPSGSGKTTIVRMVLDKMEDLFYSVSATTRKKRPGEVDGKDYIFVSHETFARWIEEGKVIEWAEIYGEFYGTPREPIDRALKEGKDVILDLDIHGKKALEKLYGNDVVSIFLLPPSIEELRRRLTSRGAESYDKLKLRLTLSKEEMKWSYEYDYIVLNDIRELATERVINIIRAERMRRERITNLGEIIGDEDQGS